QTMKLTPNGFEFTLTKPMDAKTVNQMAKYHVRHYRYPYQKKPFNEPIDFSSQEDIQEVTIQKIRLSDDKKTVTVELPLLRKGYVYEFKLEGIRSQDGSLLKNNLICYTVNQLKTN